MPDASDVRKRRVPGCVVVALGIVGLVVVGIPGAWVFVSLTAKPLFPDAASVPSVMRGAVAERWAGSVQRGRALVRESVADQNLPGVSVAVGMGGEFVWAEGFGFADVRTGVVVTPEQRFRLGTASMALTSAAVGRLVEEGRLGWDDEIGKHVPEFPKKQWAVTVRQLMGHTAGMGGVDEEAMIRKRCEKPVEALRWFGETPLLFQPGSRFRFSSYGWVLVSAAVEAASGAPWFGTMRARVLEPLGMVETGLDPGPDPVEVEGEDPPPAIGFRELIYDPGAVRGEKAVGEAKESGVAAYDTRFASNPRYGMHVMRLADFSCYAGASALVSTPSDLVRFGMGMMGGKLLQPATVESLQTAQRLASGEGTGYGLGWQVKSVTLAGKRARMVGHDGEVMGGMVASLLTFPESGLVVAVTSNIAHADTAGLGMRVAEVFAGGR